jgi:hypothetical protein
MIGNVGCGAVISDVSCGVHIVKVTPEEIVLIALK